MIINIPAIEIERPTLLEMAARIASGLAATTGGTPDSTGWLSEAEIERIDREVAVRAVHIAALIVQTVDTAIDAANPKKKKR